jgi:nucleotide-binding universal stress UspA family protein
MCAVIENAPTPKAPSRLTGGPVIACIGDRAGGLSVARIAGVAAGRLRTHVLLATVRQPTPEAASGDDGTAELMLAAIASSLTQPTDVRVTVGEPAEQLLALAEREEAQLVVVAAPPRSRARRLGNVHLALAGAAACPVVIVPPGVSVIPAEGPVVLARRTDRLPAVAERECALLVVAPSRAAASTAAICSLDTIAGSGREGHARGAAGDRPQGRIA